jgi:hypothetical protein
MFSKDSLNNFDQKNGLLGLDRDCFLSIVRFLSAKNCRKYIGISEECFQRSKHIFFTVYRLKSDNIPVRRLVSFPFFGVKYSGRSIVSLNGHQIIILSESIFESILEINLTYLAEFIQIKLIKQMKENSIWINESGSGLFYFDSYNKQMYIFFEKESTALMHIVSSLYHKQGENTMTVIIDMREGYGRMYFKINGILLPYVICNISHEKKQLQISIGDDEKITIKNIKDLNELPIEVSENCVYYNSRNGEIL